MSSHAHPGHGRALTIAAVIDYTRKADTMLANLLPADVVAKSGPRYQNFKDAWIDVQRVFMSLTTAVRDRRDHDPNILVTHLIALAGQALKAADDTAAAARHHISQSSINVENTFAVLSGDTEE